jgi:hypothetical protein
MRALVRTVFLFTLIFCATFFTSIHIAQAATDINSDIISDVTWNTAGSPYTILGQIHLATNTTLTISPGVVILFDYGSEIDVEGKIVADGTSDNKIYFTSIADSTLNGQSTEGVDTDLIIPPSMGDYNGFVFLSDSVGDFQNTEFRYAMNGLSVTNSNLTLLNNTFEDEYAPISIDYLSNFVHNGDTFLNNIYDGVSMVGGLEGKDYTFLGDTKYYISSDLNFVDNNLTVMPGVIIQSDYGNMITIIDGNFSALSAQDKANIFDGISIQIINNGSAEIKNSEIRNVWDIALLAYNNSNLDIDSVVLSGVGSGIYVAKNSTLGLKNSLIQNFGNYGVGINAFNDANIIIASSTIDTGGDGIIASNHVVLDADHIVVKNCNDIGLIAYGSNYIENNLIKLRKSIITKNNIGIFPVEHTSIDISKNSIFGNSIGVFSNSDTEYDFSNNWWGDKSGPKNNSKNPEGGGDMVSDNIIIEPWLKRDPTIAQKTPVLIVPGVLGTEMYKQKDDGGLEKLWLDLVHNLTDIGDEFMDALGFDSDLKPVDSSLVLGDVIGKISVNLTAVKEKVFDYSDSLVEVFNNQGYINNSDLFLFSYDWRYGVNNTNVSELKNKIEEIINETGSEKVDIVAHSTGGLLVKKYATEYPTTNNIDKAVFVGVPSTGSPKAIKTFLQGDSFGNLFLADGEMKKLAQNLPVVYDLAPSSEYYKNAGSFVKIINQKLFSRGERKDLSFFDMTNFLIDDHGLNSQAWTNAQNLHTPEFDNFDMRTAGVDVYAIDGCKTGTLGKVIEVRSKDIFGNNLVSYNAPQMVPGDSTVPFVSATNLPINESNKFFALNASHGEMMSQDGIRQKIVDIVSGNTSTSSKFITQDLSKCKLNGKAISVYSPLNIEIIDQYGNHTGLISDESTIENNIPNADYEIFGEHKFVYLPTDDSQKYSIQIIGTGNGVFTLTDANIANNEVTGMKVFNQIPVTTNLKGSVNIEDNPSISLDNDGDGIIDQTIIPTAVLDAQDSQDFDPVEFANSLENKKEQNSNVTQGGSRNNFLISSGQIATSLEQVINSNNDSGVIPDSIRNPGSVLHPVSEKPEVVYNNRDSNKGLYFDYNPEVNKSSSIENKIPLVANVSESGMSSNKKILYVSISIIIILLLTKRKFI